MRKETGQCQITKSAPWSLVFQHDHLLSPRRLHQWSANTGSGQQTKYLLPSPAWYPRETFQGPDRASLLQIGPSRGSSSQTRPRSLSRSMLARVKAFPCQSHPLSKCTKAPGSWEWFVSCDSRAPSKVTSEQWTRSLKPWLDRGPPHTSTGP